MLETDTLSSDTLFTVVQDSANYKITYGDLLPQLGATGTIEQLGGISGTAVLYQDGTINYIRNLEAGAGIDVAFNVDDGITITHNFTVNTTGEPLMTGETNSSPVIVSLVAGTGISLTSTNDTIEIEATSPGIQLYGLAHMQANATNTVITTVSVPVAMAGTFSAGPENDFLVSSNGRVTYLADETRIFSVMLSACLNTASGTKTCGVLIGKNGTTIAESQLNASIATGSERQITTSYLVSLATNDYVQGYVVNDTDDVDILVYACVLQVHG
jgi:hypothetical protein